MAAWPAITAISGHLLICDWFEVSRTGEVGCKVRDHSPLPDENLRLGWAEDIYLGRPSSGIPWCMQEFSEFLKLDVEGGPHVMKHPKNGSHEGDGAHHVVTRALITAVGYQHAQAASMQLRPPAACPIGLNIGELMD